MTTINLIRTKKTTTEDNLYKSQYSNWKSTQREIDAKFFILYKDFDIHLKDISSGALKLFIYYGFNSKNETGESWYSIESISKYFGVSQRSINMWNKELEMRGLISRSKGAGKSKTTYLLPFSTNIISLGEKTIDSFLNKDVTNPIFTNVYGDLSNVSHVFQWRKNQSSKDAKYNEPLNTIVYVFTKRFESFTHYTGFVYALDPEKYNNSVDLNSLYDDMYTFDSDINTIKDIYPDTITAPVQGIAINGQFNIKNKQVLRDIISQLMHPDMDLSEFYKINLIKKEVPAND